MASVKGELKDAFEETALAKHNEDLARAAAAKTLAQQTALRAEIEQLRDQWFEAPTLEARQALARQMQVEAMQDLPFIPVGAYRSQTAIRRDLADRVRGLAIFWGIRRT
jgi:hypothetical protein